MYRYVFIAGFALLQLCETALAGAQTATPSTSPVAKVSPAAGAAAAASVAPPKKKNETWTPFFMRVTLLTPEIKPVKGFVRSSWYNSPWSGHPGPNILGADGKPLPTGQASPWVDISPAFNQHNKGMACVRVTFQQAGGAPLPQTWKARVEFATTPGDGAIIKTDVDDWDGDNLAYIIPWDITSPPVDGGKIQSIHQVAARHLALVESFDLPGGKGDFRPKYFHIGTQVAAGSERQIEDEMRVANKLGFNAPYLWNYARWDTPQARANIESEVKAAHGAGMDLSKSYMMMYSVQFKDAFDPDADAVMEKVFVNEIGALKAISPEVFDKLDTVALNDEPRMLDDLREMPSSPFCQAAFRDWLKARGVTPEQVGCKTWDEVKPVRPSHTGSVGLRRLGWYSHRFSVENAGRPIKVATDIIQKTFGRPVQTRINFSDGAVAADHMSVDGNGWDFIVSGREGLTTVPWTEDWPLGNPHVTPFLADMMRSSEPARHIPLGMYIIYGWVPSKEPHFAELKTMSAVARGVKYLDHYLYGPRYSYGANTYSEDPAYLKGVAYINRVLGLADDVLGPAMPPDRKVAILWSMSTDQWRWDMDHTGVNPADQTFGMERRMLHFALTMRQIPVDFIDEDDIPSRLKEYKVLYMPGTNLVADCVPVIRDWVKDGGTLVVGNGGPERDEINEPLSGLLPLEGLKNVERGQENVRYKVLETSVPPKATAEVKFADASEPVGVAGFKAVLDPAEGSDVLGSYTDGGAAVVSHAFGRGRVVTFGFNPGITLLMKIDPKDLPKDTVFWNVFPPEELKMISDPVFQSDALPPVSTQVGVDAARLDGPDGSAVTFANYTLHPIGNLPVLVRGLKKVSKVISVIHGPLKFQFTPEGLKFDLPLDAVDVVKCYY